MNTSAETPTVFLVDDDPSVLRATTRVVQSAGWKIAAFDSAKEFLKTLKTDQPGCLVLDMVMPENNGFEVQQALERKGSTLPIIFLTGHGDIPMSVSAMKAGAADFLSKPCRDDVLLDRIQQAVERDNRNRLENAETQEFKHRLGMLTPREFEVMQHVITGKLNKLIAEELGTVEKTVKVHRSRVMKKLQVESLADLVRLAERAKIAAYRS